MVKYSNKRGKVGFDPSVFAAIAVDTAMGFYGRVFFTDRKGRPIKQSAAGSGSVSANIKDKLGFINVTENKNNNTVTVEVFIILKFGTSISWFTKEYARRLRLEAEEITGITVDEVIINITGIRSKRTAKRELRILC